MESKVKHGWKGKPTRSPAVMWRINGDRDGGEVDAGINTGSMETWCKGLVILQVRHAYGP